MTIMIFITLSLKGGMNIYYFKYFLAIQGQNDFLKSVGFDGIIHGLSNVFGPEAFEQFKKPGSALMPHRALPVPSAPSP